MVTAQIYEGLEGTELDDPTLDILLGRYEYSDGDRSDKFWTIRFEEKSGTYFCQWGRNGCDPQGTKHGLTGKEALRKISEKISKGYVLAERMEQTEARARMKKKRQEREEAFDFIDELKKL